MRADLQSKQSQLQLQIAVVKSQYLVLDAQSARRARGARHRCPAAPPGPDVLAAAPTCPAAPPKGFRPGDIAPPEAAVTPSPGGTR